MTCDPLRRQPHAGLRISRLPSEPGDAESRALEIIHTVVLAVLASYDRPVINILTGSGRPNAPSKRAGDVSPDELIRRLSIR